MTDKKVNYFYVDESGNIGNNEKLFIHGCIRTDSPKAINDALKKLKDRLSNSIYFEDFKSRILKEGFHATENHYDMKTRVYEILPILDYRAYLVITKKDTVYFNTIMKDKDESDFFKISLSQLIRDRIIKHRNDKNIFYFETIELRKKSLKIVLNELFSEFNDGYDCEWHIVGKEEENMGIIDYINYLVYYNLTNDKPLERMKHNFDLIAPKTAIIKVLHNNVFLGRKKPKELQVSLKNLIDNF